MKYKIYLLHVAICLMVVNLCNAQYVDEYENDYSGSSLSEASSSSLSCVNVINPVTGKSTCYDDCPDAMKNSSGSCKCDNGYVFDPLIGDCVIGQEFCEGRYIRNTKDDVRINKGNICLCNNGLKKVALWNGSFDCQKNCSGDKKLKVGSNTCSCKGDNNPVITIGSDGNLICTDCNSVVEGSNYNEALGMCTCSGENQLVVEDENGKFICQECEGEIVTIENEIRCVPCPDSQKYDLEKHSCVNKCLGDSFYEDGICKCQNDEKFYSEPAGKCICKGKKIWDEASNKCIKCPDGATPIAIGVGDESFTCGCPDKAVYDRDSNTCRCPNEEQIYKNGQCVNKCPQDSVYNKNTNSCDCKDRNSEFVNEKCICKDGLGKNPTGVCVRCGNGAVIDNNGNCVCNIEGAELDWTQGTPMKYYCRCTNPRGDHVKIINNKCSCEDGYKQDSNGKCVKKCNYGEIYSDSEKKCICNTNIRYVSDGKGGCTYCDVTNGYKIVYVNPLTGGAHTTRDNLYNIPTCKRRCAAGSSYNDSTKKCYKKPVCAEGNTVCESVDGNGVKSFACCAPNQRCSNGSCRQLTREECSQKCKDEHPIISTISMKDDISCYDDSEKLCWCCGATESCGKSYGECLGLFDSGFFD